MILSTAEIGLTETKRSGDEQQIARVAGDADEDDGNIIVVFGCLVLALLFQLKKAENVNRILIVKCDVNEPDLLLTKLQRECIATNTTFILVWSDDEACQYLHTFN